MILTGPPPTPVIPAQWRELTVVFRLPTGRILTVDGHALGTLAVHPSWDTDSGVTITHLPTKLVVARMEDAAGAVQAVEWLWERCRHVWIKHEVDPAAVPQDVMDWIRS